MVSVSAGIVLSEDWCLVSLAGLFNSALFIDSILGVESIPSRPFTSSPTASPEVATLLIVSLVVDSSEVLSLDVSFHFDEVTSTPRWLSRARISLRLGMGLILICDFVSDLLADSAADSSLPASSRRLRLWAYVSLAIHTAVAVLALLRRGHIEMRGNLLQSWRVHFNRTVSPIRSRPCRVWCLRAHGLIRTTMSGEIWWVHLCWIRRSHVG